MGTEAGGSTPGDPARTRLRGFFEAAEPSFLLTACAVGVLTGLGAIALAEAIAAVQWLALGSAGDPRRALAGLPAWRILLVPAAGGLAVGALAQWFREVGGHGVPDVMEAVALRGGHLPRRVALTRALASALTLGTGGSAGREGPVAHIGAGVGSTVGQWLRLPAHRLRTLTAAGAAGGIAASFNAPIAGAFFALEVVARNFATPTFAPVVLCAVVATVVSRAHFGPAPAFGVPALELGGVREVPLAAALGIFCGFVSLAFIVVLGRLERGFARLPAPAALKAALGGLAVGAMVLGAPELFGVGHPAMDAMLRGELPARTLFLLLLLKPLATSATLASGGSGGVFLPALFVGGLAGGLFGGAALPWLPDLVGSPGVLVLVGMAAVLAGTSHAPITALLLAFELTQSYQVILPVMVAVALSTLVARALRRHSIYTEKLLARGIDLDRREDLVLRGIAVSEAMRRDPPAVRHDAPLDAVLARFLESPLDAVFVIDAQGRPVGQVTLHEVKEALAESADLLGLVVARDVCEGAVRIRPQESLAAALDRLTRQGRELLAVVDEGGRLVGGLSLRAVTDVIAREALRGEFVGVAAAEPGGARRLEALRLGTGIHVRPLEVPASLVGASVGALELRRRFGVSVLSVRRDGVDRGVEPARPLEPGDTLVVMGDAADLARFAAWLSERH